MEVSKEMSELSEQRIKLKTAAREAIHNTKPSLIWITLVYVGIVWVLQILLWSVSGELEAMAEMMESFMATGASEQILPETTGFGSVLTAAIQIMAMLLGVGFSIACLRVIRGRGCAFGNLLDGFGMILRVLCVQILRYFILAAWSMVYAMAAVLVSSVIGMGGMLVCLPLLYFAFRAMYSYRQAIYLLIDNPGLNPLHCLGVSKQLMKGHCWELFVLDLSFLGWEILSLIPFVGLWVRPYREVTCAAFYDDLMLRSAREQGAVPPQEEEPGPEEPEE